MKQGMTWLQEMAGKSGAAAQPRKEEVLPRLREQIKTKGKFDKVAYQREYMRKRRAAEKLNP